MPIHIVIDGYNLIRQSRSFQRYEQQSLEDGRHALLDTLAAYKRLKKHPITVVFDGAEVFVTGEQRDRWKGIDVVFSRRGESADRVIKKMAAREGERAVVVTSDRAIASYAAQQGSAIIASVDFERKMTLATHMDADPFDFAEEGPGWMPGTKKKGPARRRSKRERKRRVKMKKL
jgi:predicted RNA-binding protein with PIN domain